MSINIAFLVCRICLRANITKVLKSMFDDFGLVAEMFRIITGIDLNKDKHKHEVVICQKCTKALNRAYELRCDAENAEQYYFEYERERYDNEQRNENCEITVNSPEISSIYQDIQQDSTLESGESDELNRTQHNIEVEFDDTINNSGLNHENSADDEENINNNEDVKRCNKLSRGNEESHSDCGANEKPPTFLKEHIEQSHEETKTFHCDLCTLSFTYKRVLQRHMNIHIKIQNIDNECPTSLLNLDVVSPTNEA